MTRTVPALVLLLPAVVLAHDVGDKLVVVEPTDAMIESGVVGKVHPGAVFVVQRVNGDWLWPNLPKPGWIHASSVREIDAGIARFGRDIAKNARDAQAFWARGQAYRAKGDATAATRDFDEVIRLAPRSHLGYLSRGTIRYENEDWDAALADFDKAVELEPENAASRQLRNLVYAAKGDWDKAVEELNLVVERDPKDARGYNGRAWLRATCPEEAFRDGPAALADAKKACELTGHLNFRCLGTLAAANAELGNFEEAVKRQKQAIKIAPEEYRASFGERLKLYESGQPYRAIRGGEIR